MPEVQEVQVLIVPAQVRQDGEQATHSRPICIYPVGQESKQTPLVSVAELMHEVHKLSLIVHVTHRLEHLRH